MVKEPSEDGTNEGAYQVDCQAHQLLKGEEGMAEGWHLYRIEAKPGPHSDRSNLNQREINLKINQTLFICINKYKID